MKCSIIKDLIPLYIDGCCSEESRIIVEEHIKDCDACRIVLEDMDAPSDAVVVSSPQKAFRKLDAWKASIMQSVLLFVSFGVITIGVALEAQSPSGLMNGFWAWNLVIPATGFMLSLANWYFISVYKNRKLFSNCSFVTTLVITLGAYIWSCFHYNLNFFELFKGSSFAEALEVLHTLCVLNGIGLFLMVIFCALSKLLSNQYAKMLGKE